jgi:hypothetical protein
VTSPIVSVGIICWGLFMIGGAGWAVYAGRRDRSGGGDTALAETVQLEGDRSGSTDEHSTDEQSTDEQSTDDTREDVTAPDALIDEGEAGGPQLGGYIVAGLIVLLGVGVVAMGLWTLL